MDIAKLARRWSRLIAKSAPSSSPPLTKVREMDGGKSESFCPGRGEVLFRTSLSRLLRRSGYTGIGDGGRVVLNKPSHFQMGMLIWLCACLSGLTMPAALADPYLDQG